MVKKYLKISEFAILSGISRKNLIFYDRIGLLSPQLVDQSNGYRYYSYRQIDTAGVITALREIGMPLKEIKAYLSQRSPEQLEVILENQNEILEAQIVKLLKIKDLINVRLDRTRKGLRIDTDTIAVEEHSEENLFLGPKLPSIDDLDVGWRYIQDLYSSCPENDIPIGFPVGSIIEKKNLQSHNWKQPDCYYCRLPGGNYPSFFTKPGGTYITGSEYTDYGFTDNLYSKLLRFIEKNNFSICGNAYEEFLLDEIALSNPNRYLLHIVVHVRGGTEDYDRHNIKAPRDFTGI